MPGLVPGIHAVRQCIPGRIGETFHKRHESGAPF